MLNLRSLARSIRNAGLIRAAVYADRKIPGTAAAAVEKSRFIMEGGGVACGVTKQDRRRLVAQFDRINAGILSATNTIVQLALAREILSIPPEVRGDIVECGCYKGASSAALSLVAALVGRRLIVCDSFEGLPDDDAPVHIAPHSGHYGHYKRGMFLGSLDEVKANMAAYGDASVCSFFKGFFSESLPALKDPIAFAFLDVDLESSTRDALRYIWPLLVKEGAVFTDDAGDPACVRPFFDEAWWQATFGQPAPGFIGSGCGLGPLLASNGYTRKGKTDTAKLKRVPWLHYPDHAPITGTANHAGS